MAKLVNPLHSLVANGTLGKVLTFRDARGRAVAVKKPRASTARTAAQAARRDAYQLGCAAWQAMLPEQQAAWRKQGIPYAITGFNAWMRYFLTTYPLPIITRWDGGTTVWDGGATVWLDAP